MEWVEPEGVGGACSPALGQSVVAEVEDELMKRVRLLPLFLLLLFFHFGLRLLDTGEGGRLSRWASDGTIKFIDLEIKSDDLQQEG